MRRSRRKKMREADPIRCIIFLSSDETNDFDMASRKEDKQFRYINEYAKAHNLEPMGIVRRGCFEGHVKNTLFNRIIGYMEQGKAEALLVANMYSISTGIADAYFCVGKVKEQGFRVFTADEGELGMKLYQPPQKMKLEVWKTA